VHFSTDPGQRREFIGGLRQLAAFLDANPGVPVPLYSTAIGLHTTGSDAETFAAVDRIAGPLGATPPRTRGGHYTATRRFTTASARHRARERTCAGSATAHRCSGGRLWQHANLLQDARLINDRPVLDDLAVANTVDRDPLGLDLFVSRRDPE
jgi:hypothetical protein